jgi:large subunit ribosomal protein L7/L12
LNERGIIVATIEEIVETLSQLSVLDMAKLKTALEEKWGVKAAVAAAPVAAAAAAAPEAAASESTEFEVALVEAPMDKRIGIIKVVREVTGLGLKEAKELTEKVPAVLKPKASKAEADEMIAKVQAAGGKASKKGL